MTVRRFQAHRHLLGEPCAHCLAELDAPLAEFPDGRYAWPDDYPPLTWPNVLVVAIGVAAILVAVALVGLAFIALAGPGQ